MTKRKQIPFHEWGYYADTNWDKNISRLGTEANRLCNRSGYGNTVGEVAEEMRLFPPGERTRGMLKQRLKRETL